MCRIGFGLPVQAGLLQFHSSNGDDYDRCSAFYVRPQAVSFSGLA